MLDATDPSKSLKVIKDSHKNVSICNLGFCDWNKPSKGKSEKMPDSKVESETSKMDLTTDKVEESPYMKAAN